jgi:hypothetical protein
VVDVVGDVRVEISHGVVRQTAQVDDGVEPLHVAGPQISQVLADAGDVGDTDPEGALLEQVAVQPDQVVPGGLQHRHHHTADIATMPGHQDAHQSRTTLRP